MSSSFSQRQVLKLQQKLSPQQIQMIKLLELPSLQLEQRIKQEIEENPVLEEERHDESGEEQEPKEISVDEYLKEDDTPYYKLRANNYSKDDKQPTVTMSGGQSLQEFLEEQLGYKELSNRDLAVAKYLIGSLDDDGYLRRDLLSVSDDIAFSVGLDISVAELERVLAVIHQLEPAGVGARDLQECLVLQLDAQAPLNESQQLARRILTGYFDDFAKKHYDRLQSRLGVERDEFAEAIEEIRHLSPKPGNLYGDAPDDAAPYVVPDFVLDYDDGEFDLRLNSYNIPDLKVNRRYMDMIRQSMSGGITGEQDQEALKFVKSKIESAKWFISAIKQRHDTLLGTMTEIFEYQREYFADGDPKKLKPMILRDIADRTGLDVSTISRVVNSKYVQTHFGIIPLKSLFSEAMQTDSGEEVSSHQIKQILSDCIAGEDKQHPLTDEALMDILNDKGFHIARRTVAKYREMLKIPVARLRREI
ncbi:MAG: RNA polymerase factor sigma-54 [Rikenellaceae bacterium]|nr:RNA polymerase factor sigma-54 [Rikenellaceae bacterium]